MNKGLICIPYRCEGHVAAFCYTGGLAAQQEYHWQLRILEPFIPINDHLLSVCCMQRYCVRSGTAGKAMSLTFPCYFCLYNLFLFKQTLQGVFAHKKYKARVSNLPPAQHSPVPKPDFCDQHLTHKTHNAFIHKWPKHSLLCRPSQNTNMSWRSI